MKTNYGFETLTMAPLTVHEYEELSALDKGGYTLGRLNEVRSDATNRARSIVVRQDRQWFRVRSNPDAVVVRS